MSRGVPKGQAVVLEVAQLEALLAKTFNVGLDVGRGKDKVALVRLGLAKALVGVVEANPLAAESGVSPDCPGDGDHHGAGRDRTDPRAPDNDRILDTALQAVTGLQQLLQFRRDCPTATTAAEREAASARLINAEVELIKAAEAVSGLLELARMTAASGPHGKPDLN